MFDECPGCGTVQIDAPVEVDGDGAAVVCPACDHREPIRREPLSIVTGASGTGKSAVLRELRGTREDVVLLDSDVLWRPSFWEARDWFVQTWLRLCRDVAQAGRPPVLFGAGVGVPHNVEAHPQRDCFAGVEYLALVCDPGEQRRRLRARPPGRHPDGIEMDDEAIADQVEFNEWLRDVDREDFETVDTTDATVEATARRVDEWITARIGEADE